MVFMVIMAFLKIFALEFHFIFEMFSRPVQVKVQYQVMVTS